MIKLLKKQQYEMMEPAGQFSCNYLMIKGRWRLNNQPQAEE